MGLLSFTSEGGVYDLKPTPLGERVYMEDPYLLEGLTRLVCNYYLTDKQDGAPQWSYIFHTLPHLLDQPVDCEYLKDRCNAFFGFPVELGVVKNSYQSGMFESLKMLNWSDKALVFNRGLFTETSTLKNFGKKVLADEELRKDAGFVAGGLATAITTSATLSGLLHQFLITVSLAVLSKEAVKGFLRVADLWVQGHD